MSNRYVWESKSVHCPYYKGEERQVIRCQGVAEHSNIKLTFDSKEAKVKYRKAICENSCQSCVIAAKRMEEDEV